MSSPKQPAGFTLIELTMYVSIVGALLISVSMFFAVTLQSRIKNQAITEVNQQGLAIMEYMAQTIRTATSITSPAIGASANSLTIVVPTGALSPTIFNLSGTTLQVKEGAAAAIALTNNNVQIASSDLTFTNVSRSGTVEAVQISIKVTSTNTSGRSEYAYEKTFTSTVAIR